MVKARKGSVKVAARKINFRFAPARCASLTAQSSQVRPAQIARFVLALFLYFSTQLFPSITHPFPSRTATRERPLQFLKVSHTMGSIFHSSPYHLRGRTTGPHQSGGRKGQSTDRKPASELSASETGGDCTPGGRLTVGFASILSSGGGGGCELDETHGVGSRRLLQWSSSSEDEPHPWLSRLELAPTDAPGLQALKVSHTRRCGASHFFMPPAAPVSSCLLHDTTFPSITHPDCGAGKALPVLESVEQERLLRLDAG